GGSELATEINVNLAAASEEKGWAIGLGSTRALLESSAHEDSVLIRKQAKTVPVIANLGAVQSNYGYGVDECQRIVDVTEAAFLMLHLNSVLEIVQDGGDLIFEDLLSKIEEVCKDLFVPVVVKEVSFGIDGTVAEKVYSVGVHYIAVAGAG